ncbi:MAG: folylpolyglutamate synthase/dihydrofolate synthase family protein [Verrucomicrobiota bacterium]
MMTYEESLAWLYSTQRIGIKLGLENTHRLLAFLEVDPGDTTIFHVAGTNGKGSTCAFLESVCREAGLKTGLFTSPHLVSFRERIRIDFEPAAGAPLAEILTQIREEVESWDPHPSFFEITTALGMRTFLDAGTQAIILETGLGGRLDSTNAIASSVTGISSISLDHQKWLGDTLAEIAGEKAGIIKAGKPVVTIANQQPDAAQVIRDRAEALGSPLHTAEDYCGEIGIAGKHQLQNAGLAAKMIEVSSLSISEADRERGIATAMWPGRFHRMSYQDSPVIIDGAHNTDAAEALVETWKSEFGEQKAAILFGAVADKEPQKLLKALSPITGALFPTTIASQRGMSAEDLAAQIGESTPIAPSVSLGLRLAEATRLPILITGSFFLAGQALEALGWGDADFEVSEQ